MISSKIYAAFWLFLLTEQSIQIVSRNLEITYYVDHKNKEETYYPTYKIMEGAGGGGGGYDIGL